MSEKTNETSLSRHCGNGGMLMNIGFVGAGKVGFSMGKYLTERGEHVTGYYSRSPHTAQEAAEFTDTRQYLSMKDLAEDSDALFLTVPDGAIASVWEQLKMLPIQNKLIIHCSGAMSSAVFSDIGRCHAYGYSIHPLLAVNDKYNSYQELSGAFFTIEGDERYLAELKAMFEGFGNTVETICARDKVRYHAAAAMASNLYVGLVNLCEELLGDCGFSAGNAHKALMPLIRGNTENIAACGTVQALTGPVERNDIATVREHLSCLSGESREVYRVLSGQVLKVARQKHPERDYTMMEGEFQQ